jgi:hypothetical protein
MKDGLRPGPQRQRGHCLRHPVAYGGHAQHSRAPRGLRYLHRPHRRREVRARGHPVPDLVKVVLQVLLKRLDGHAVRPGRTAVRLHLPPGLPHQLLRYSKRLSVQP